MKPFAKRGKTLNYMPSAGKHETICEAQENMKLFAKRGKTTTLGFVSDRVKEKHALGLL